MRSLLVVLFACGTACLPVLEASSQPVKRGVYPVSYPPAPAYPLDDPYLLSKLLAKAQPHIAVPVGPSAAELSASLAAARDASHAALAARQKAAAAREAAAEQAQLAASKEAAAAAAAQRAEAAVAAADALQRSHATAQAALAVQRTAAASAAAAAAAAKAAAAHPHPVPVPITLAAIKKDWAPWG